MKVTYQPNGTVESAEIVIDNVNVSGFICSYTMQLSLGDFRTGTLDLLSIRGDGSGELYRFVADHMRDKRQVPILVTHAGRRSGGFIEPHSMTVNGAGFGEAETVAVTARITYLTPLTGEEN